MNKSGNDSSVFSDAINFIDGYKKTVKHIAEGPIDSLFNLSEKVNSSRKQSQTLEALSYNDVLVYAVNQQSRNPEISTTLLKASITSNGIIHITQIFANEEGELLRKGNGFLGRNISTKTIAADLLDIWGSDITSSPLPIGLSN